MSSYASYNDAVRGIFNLFGYSPYSVGSDISALFRNVPYVSSSCWSFQRLFAAGASVLRPSATGVCVPAATHINAMIVHPSAFTLTLQTMLTSSLQSASRVGAWASLQVVDNGATMTLPNLKSLPASSVYGFSSLMTYAAPINQEGPNVNAIVAIAVAAGVVLVVAAVATWVCRRRRRRKLLNASNSSEKWATLKEVELEAQGGAAQESHA
jgi:hypothetical protein